jgi:hypothetical protein
VAAAEKTKRRLANSARLRATEKVSLRFTAEILLRIRVELKASLRVSDDDTLPLLHRLTGYAPPPFR